MTLEHMSLNWLAILVSVVASFAIGSIWYGPLFGKTWAKSMGFENPPSGSEIAKGSALNVLGTFLIAFVLAFEIGLFRPSAWNHEVPDAAPHVYGFIYGFLTWLGFVVPVLLNGVAFERKSWKAFTIGAVFQLISLQVMAMILAYWR